MVHVGPTHTRLASMEIDNLVVPFSLAHCLPQLRNLARDRPNFATEVQKTSFGRDRPNEIPTSPETSHALEASAHTSRIRKFISYGGNDMNYLVRVPSVYTIPDMPLLSHVLPDGIAPLHNPHTLTCLHITARFNLLRRWT